jgi:MFS family permease
MSNALSSKFRSLRSLDWLNFFLADVQTGIGPFLAIYLTATRHWNPARVGIAVSAAGIATLAAQTLAGALIDASRYKRWLVAAAVALVGLGCIVTVSAQGLAAEVSIQAFVGLAGAIFPTAMAAISLGVVGRQCLSRRIGRNEGFNHAGNVAFAMLAGLVGTLFSPAWIFYSSAVAAIGAIAAVLLIRERDIDHVMARGGEVTHTRDLQSEARWASWRELLRDRRIRAFAASVVIFHFANAAMLPLVGELLSQGKPRESSLYMSACIIIAQMVMVPAALITGRVASSWGRKLPFQIGFTVLALRGFLYTAGHNPNYLIAVQGLDGIGAGIFGVLWVLIAADLAKGTRRFNLLQGTIQACLGLGAFLSNSIAGFVVKSLGYNAGFFMLASIACAGLWIFTLKMPETCESEMRGGRVRQVAVQAALPR